MLDENQRVPDVEPESPATFGTSVAAGDFATLVAGRGSSGA